MTPSTKEHELFARLQKFGKKKIRHVNITEVIQEAPPSGKEAPLYITNSLRI